MKYLDLKFAILRKFPTQADFALAIGEHESKISQVLRGRRKLSLEEAERWRKGLNCDRAMLEPVIKGKHLSAKY